METDYIFKMIFKFLSRAFVSSVATTSLHQFCRNYFNVESNAKITPLRNSEIKFYKWQIKLRIYVLRHLSRANSLVYFIKKMQLNMTFISAKMGIIWSKNA